MDEASAARAAQLRRKEPQLKRGISDACRAKQQRKDEKVALQARTNAELTAVLSAFSFAKSRAAAGGSNYPENGLVKPPRRDTRALSPAGMFGGQAPLRLATRKLGLACFLF
jgi:hypothetical protein